MSPKKPIDSRENTPETGEVNGIFNREKKEQVPRFNQRPSEKVISKGNSWIVLGRDRPSTKESGYGGSGDSRASSIDLVVGRQGTNPSDDTVIDPNFGALSLNRQSGDAARIHISQRTDVDANFGLREGKRGMSVGKSAIALKADDVRVIAREGIKLVTGGSKVVDSKGNKSNIIHGIELIAGNLDLTDQTGRDYIQPLVKGTNLKDFLFSLTEQVNNLNSLIQRILEIQVKVNNALLAPHTSSPTGGPTVPNPATISTVLTSNTEFLADAVIELQLLRDVVLLSLVGDYLIEDGDVNILSKHNRTN
jgi:hypothetical protein